MKNLHFENSYNIWDSAAMKEMLIEKCYAIYGEANVARVLNRSYFSMFIEWWLHNIGYYFTLPLCKHNFFRKLNLRFKDVDINEHI
jgi:hypothetical protein